MPIHKQCCVFALVVTIVTASMVLAESDSEPNAADLVRDVRAQQAWLHRIDNLQFRAEGTWTHPPESIAIRYAELKKQDPNREPDPRYHPGLQPRATDILEFAIDFKNQRLRYVEHSTRDEYLLRIWDGKELVFYFKWPEGHEEYYRQATTESIAGIFGSLSWTKEQPHSFWWDPKGTEWLNAHFPVPEDFRITGRVQHRGVDCYQLDFEWPGVPDQVFQWYIGRDNHRLYGTADRIVEHWLSDYREVTLGCWIPMTQGYSIKGYDSQSKRWYVSVRRDVRLADVRVNEPLPEALFQVEWKEGVYVTDSRSGQTKTYKYTPVIPSFLGEPLPDVTELGIEGAAERIADKPVLLCFLDLDQRPSRHCLMQLSEAHERGIVILPVDLSTKDRKSLDRWKQAQAMPFPLTKCALSRVEVRKAWGVKSLPWLVLTDAKHVVTAEGFGVSDLGGKIE